ncbi:uncharacterized protein FOMMEDRAFT_162980 [Fomitiporia mediterranea MF3/22]|uniref:Uncharacterized protein n=1 Tax=Fomitiporia mediterranea (strain MF3/22) TaxID=694068 RepID=R7SGG9_FOMME|nr:uncharacterized protein FOMMEDRAFT_162980 [Fomitiporia mediterranea MF3/22]EJC97525.1 hypothetical protein FOMMEDRAFT_162980 [Fomitiporia mediterranea MF3/22]
MSKMQGWGATTHLNLAELTGALSLSEEPESYADDLEGESYVRSTSTPSQNEGVYLKSRGKKKKEKQEDPAKVNMQKNIHRSSSSYEPELEDPPAESLPQIRKRSTRSSTGGSNRVGFKASVTRYSETGQPEDDVINTEKNKHPKRKTGIRRKPSKEYRAAQEKTPIYPGK